MDDEQYLHSKDHQWVFEPTLRPFDNTTSRSSRVIVFSYSLSFCLFHTFMRGVVVAVLFYIPYSFAMDGTEVQ